MKTRLLLLLILMQYSSLWAQDSTFVTVKAGYRISDVLTVSDIYLHPQFVYGTVLFRSGAKSAAKMNYNSLYDEMLFIDPKGDTLALTDEKTIKVITLAKDTFYYEDGYIRQVTNNNVVKLAEKRIWELADIRKVGSHGRPANTGVTSLRTVTDELGTTRDLVLSEDLILRKRAAFYFGDQYNHFVPAVKKNLLHFFPREENNLADYMKENKVNFSKKEDLEKVALFLAKKN